MRKFLNTLFFVVAILFFVIFALSNAQTVQLNFLGRRLLMPVPISLLILIPFLIGIILGSVLNLVERISLKRELKRLRKDLVGRNAPLPLKDSRLSSASHDKTEGNNL